MRSWQQRIQEEFGQPTTNVNFQRLLLELLDSFSDRFKVKSQLLARVVLSVIRHSESILLLIPRHIFSRLFPFDPLGKMAPTSISVAILTSKKDLEILPYSIAGLIHAAANPIFGLQIVCPENVRYEVQKVLSKLGFPHKFKISILTDEEILRKVGLEKFDFVSSVAKMELLKLLIGYQSENPTLILDGDTLLLRTRNWISGNSQITPVAQEYFLGHKRFSERILMVQNRFGLGYVTHHAIFVSEQVQKIINAAGGVEELATEINDGIRKGWGGHGEFPSEWQLYGDSLSMNETFMQQYPANFSNLGIDRKSLNLLQHPSKRECLNVIARIKKAAPALGSISLHGYK